MPELKENEFSYYEFSDEEVALAADYNDLQLKYIRTRRAMSAIEKCNMQASGLDDKEYIKRQQYLAGMLAAYDVLLVSHETTQALREELARRAVADAAFVASNTPSS